MSGYTVVFDSVYHGTLCGKWPTLPVWLTILPMADKNGHIDLTFQAISALTGWPLDLLKQAISDLMQPDPDSRSEAEEGRRLVLLDPANRQWGWRVVNHTRYREKARKAAYDAARTASGADAERKREERASRDVPRSPASSRSHTPNTNTDSNKNQDSRSVAQERDDSPVERVFEHWRREHKHPRAVLDAKRRRAIEGALKSYDERTLCESISGYLHSPHHMGQNDQRTTYDEITLFLRDAEHIDKGLRFARAPPPQQQSAVEKARAKLLNGGNHGSDRESEAGMGEVTGVLRRLTAS